MDPEREPTFGKRAVALSHAVEFARRTAEGCPPGNPARDEWLEVANELRTEIRTLHRTDLDWWAVHPTG